MRRASQDPPFTDLEAEGLPPVEDQPPGIDDQSAVEGLAPPRDHPVAADDYGTTPAEGRMPERLEDRLRREQPEARGAEVRPGRLLAPDGGGLADDEATEVAELAEDDTDGLLPEEAAMHIEPEQPGEP
ncbi:MAG TPA: hypothetical protein VE990_07755 [Acidimicrobiales bacterium]|nr:hypothetical protein [Acidimicrobiales bacterium]